MSQNFLYPFAIRLIGFAADEAERIEEIFAPQESHAGYGYFCLPEDNLQDPDLFLANADEGKALAALSYLGPSDLRPALVIGKPEADVPYPCISRPIHRGALLQALAKLIEKRADALSRLEASDIVTVPERRRKNRFDIEPKDSTEYGHMRRPRVDGGVLIVDKNPTLADYVTELLARRSVSVAYVNDESTAAAVCKSQRISLVIINTSAPGVEPYRLCETIKTQVAERAAVIFLVSKPFVYDLALARHVGCDGFLNKPLTTKHLVSMLKKFLPSLAR